MHSRLIRNSVTLAVIPMAAIILSSIFQGFRPLWIALALTGSAVQIVVILFFKKGLRRLFQPPVELLRRIGTAYMPAAYEPNKYKIDFKVAGFFIWVGAAAPILVLLAQNYPRTICNPILNFATYTGPNTDLLALAFLCIAAGPLALILWAKLGQAMVIANEGGESKRYLFRGFAEEIENVQNISLYLRNR